MSTIVIQIDPKHSELLKELAERLGGQVTEVQGELLEDLALGLQMESVKTGQSVSRATVMKKLRKQ
ncbi:MAG: hypothetical protein ACFCUH_13115 [Flavobacteriales bacterium]